MTYLHYCQIWQYSHHVVVSLLAQNQVEVSTKHIGQYSLWIKNRIQQTPGTGLAREAVYPRMTTIRTDLIMLRELCSRL